ELDDGLARLVVAHIDRRRHALQHLFGQFAEGRVGAQEVENLELFDLHEGLDRWQGWRKRSCIRGRACFHEPLRGGCHPWKRACPRTSYSGSAQRTRGSDIRPLITATVDISSTMVKGRPVDTAIACSATRPPPRMS